MTLADALAAYKICARAEGKSAKTIRWIADAVRYFSGFLSDISLGKISPSHLRGFIGTLQAKQAWSNHPTTPAQDRPLSAESIKSYTRAIKTFFSFLEGEGLIDVNPVAKVKLPKAPQKVMPTFTEKDVEKLLAQPDKKTDIGFRDYVVMLCLLDTGLRVSELCGLKVDDVDLTNGYLRTIGKGQRERFVPIGAKLTKALMKYQLAHRPHTNCDNFFVTADGRQLTTGRVERIIKDYGIEAGIKTRCSPHTFRSSSAVLYLRNGGDPFSLQKKLGHSTLVMTRRYSNLADSDVRAQHLKYGVVDRLKV